VLVAQGNGQDAFDQVVLCEYLASRGFVVATTASPTRRVPLERDDQVGAVAQRQADDLAAIAAIVSRTLPVDAQHIGVVAHSLGARGALLFAMTDPRVRALVSLDGGIGTATAVSSLRGAPAFRADAPIPPLLHFYEELDAFMAPDFAFLRTLHTRALTLERVDTMHHVHFTTYGYIAARFPDLAQATKAMPGTARDVVRVSERTARFLERALTR
jgi:dienelactone hydrolase